MSFEGPVFYFLVVFFGPHFQPPNLILYIYQVEDSSGGNGYPYEAVEWSLASHKVGVWSVLNAPLSAVPMPIVVSVSFSF
jgi:hypothetical protein